MLYVIIQFSAIIFLIINSNIMAINLISIILIVISIIIALSALITMKITNLNVLPQLKNNHKLVTKGIYSYIRHPMYLSVLLLCLAFLLTNISIINLIIYAVLVIDLILKSNLEEKLLAHRFNDYNDYKKNTGKLFPNLKIITKTSAD